MTICFILAAPRSGTTLLGDAVARSFGAAWPQEIFNDAYATADPDFRSHPDIRVRGNFFNHRHALLNENASLSFPSRANQQHLFQTYLASLAASEGCSRFLLDVKYTSTHHLDDYWRFSHDIPHLIKLIRDSSIQLVHLKRCNLFSLYCSQVYAELTGIWWATEDRKSDAEMTFMTLDPLQCRRYLDGMASTMDLFSGWLADQRWEWRCWELEYESMFEAGEFADSVVETFSTIYGVEPSSPLTTRYQKVTPPLSAIVQNADDILKALHGTPFQAMAEEALIAA